MKKILAVLLFSFFVSQSVLAEYSLDYVDTKKRGNMDQNVKCTNDRGESMEYGFKTIPDPIPYSSGIGTKLIFTSSLISFIFLLKTLTVDFGN